MILHMDIFIIREFHIEIQLIKVINLFLFLQGDQVHRQEAKYFTFQIIQLCLNH